VPAAQDLFIKEMNVLLQNESYLHSIGTYDNPKGHQRFRENLAEFLCDSHGWPISADNIAITNGSQNSFFYLFNALAGKMPDGTSGQIQLPITPEYIGYADIGISEGMFTASLPKIELLDERQFKYRVDFKQLEIADSSVAMCLSRPTNPTGNVVTDNELAKLDVLARQHDIPLIIDGAYGTPFPNLVYESASAIWNDNTILALSLSKLGLPGVRTGIVVANKEVITLMGRVNAIATLAPNSMGAAIMNRLMVDREVKSLCEDILQPFYQQKLSAALELFGSYFLDFPVRYHKPEGAFFMWLWFEDLPVASRELYERLKERLVLIIPGEDFFIDVDKDWLHQRECIRINYAQPQDKLERGFKIIAEEIQQVYEAG
ncbi:MAG: valine--pyruvate transaminase, partial [Pseudomonadota bacterium]